MLFHPRLLTAMMPLRVERGRAQLPDWSWIQWLCGHESQQAWPQGGEQWHRMGQRKRRELRQEPLPRREPTNAHAHLHQRRWLSLSR